MNRMSNREAIALLRNLEDSLDSYCELNEEGKTAFRMAIEALEIEQRILDNGYTGKEAEFRIGGKLFGIREKAQ